MTTKVNQFIRNLRSLGKIRLAAELGRMGIHLRQRASLQQMQQVIDTLSPEIVEKHINRTVQQPSLPKVEKKVQLLNGGLVSFEMSAFHEALIKIHQNYLNQYTLKYVNDPQLIKQQATNRQKCRDEVNSLLGIREEIKLDPKRITHLHQEDAATLTNTIFPSFTDQEYQKRLFSAHRIWKGKLGKNTDAALMKELLLITYGMKKEKEFEKVARDYIEYVLYPVKPLVNQHQITEKSKKNFIYTFVERQKYNQAIIASMPVSDLANFMGIIKKQLMMLKIGPVIFHSFTLALSDSIVRRSSIFSHTPINDHGKAVLQQICDFLKAFRLFITSSKEIDRSSQSQFFQILASYNSIKHHLAPFSSQIPQKLLLELDQDEWYDTLLIKVERMIDQVGVSELQGRNVVQKLGSMKITVEFLAAEEIDTTIELLEKLLFTIRSGIEWMTLESKNKEKDQNPLFVSEIQEFFDMRLCSRIIKVIFMGGDIAFDLQLVLNFFWKKFLRVQALKQSTIQTIFFLINITIRYKCTTILKDHQEEAFHLFSRSVKAIGSNDYRELLQVEVMDFLKEQAALLLENTYRQKFIEEMESSLSAGQK